MNQFDRFIAFNSLRRFERRLKKLQDRLGALNDIAVHQRLAGDLAGGNGRKRALTVGVVAGQEQSRIAPLRAAAIKAADKFRQARPYWASRGRFPVSPQGATRSAVFRARLC